MNTQLIKGAVFRWDDYLIKDLTKLTGKIGILGGTFDPIHLDHIAMAESAAKSLNLDSIVYLPTPQNPLKTGLLFETRDRVEMLLRAVAGKSNTYVCTVEIDNFELNKKETRTVDTLDLINSKKSPKAEIFFLLGSDCLPDLHQWKSFHELFQKTTLVPVQRGEEKDKLIEILRSQGKLTEEEIKCLESNWVKFETVNPAGEYISSTQIREKLEAGEVPLHLLPPSVGNYIAENF